MNKNLYLVIIAIILLLIGYGVSWVVSDKKADNRSERIIAIKWGDGKYGEAFYGAQVYLEPTPDGYSVRGLVYIGRGNGYINDLGEFGKVKSDIEAVKKFGNIEFKPDGLHIGDGIQDNYFLPREKLESHR